MKTNHLFNHAVVTANDIKNEFRGAIVTRDEIASFADGLALPAPVAFRELSKGICFTTSELKQLSQGACVEAREIFNAGIVTGKLR